MTKLIKEFIKNQTLLEETVSENDLLNVEVQVSKLNERISQLKKSGMIGIVGAFGKGKSTLIKQVEKNRDFSDEKWVNFEAWEFPERKELWEGFVLEMAKQLDSDTFEAVFKKIEGRQNDDKKTLLNVFASIPTLSVISNFNHFFETSPAKRVFQIQKILLDLFKKIKESTVVIVVEDTDRSGPEGIYFIETLKYFIKNVLRDKKVIVVVPISETSFYGSQESYLKSLDIIDFIDIRHPNLKKFFTSILFDEVESNDLQLLTDFFSYCLHKYPDTTLRKIKLILRSANLNHQASFQNGDEPDWRLSILFSAMRFFVNDKTQAYKESYFDLYRREMVIPRNSVYAAYLYFVYQNPMSLGHKTNFIDKNINFVNPKMDFKFTTRTDNQPGSIRSYPSIPYTSQSYHDDESVFWVCDFYFNY